MAFKVKDNGQNQLPGKIIKQGKSSAEAENKLKKLRQQQIAEKMYQQQKQATHDQQVVQKERKFMQQNASRLNQKPSRDVADAYDRAFRRNAKKTR